MTPRCYRPGAAGQERLGPPRSIPATQHRGAPAHASIHVGAGRARLPAPRRLRGRPGTGKPATQPTAGAATSSREIPTASRGTHVTGCATCVMSATYDQCHPISALMSHFNAARVATRQWTVLPCLAGTGHDSNVGAAIGRIVRYTQNSTQPTSHFSSQGVPVSSQYLEAFPGNSEEPAGTHVGGTAWIPTRRSVLRSGGGIAGAALFVLPFPGSVLTRENVAAASARPSTSSVREEFSRAVRQYGVPAAVLLAMGYVNTRLEMPTPDASGHRDGDPEGRGAYGIMALARNSFSDTLGAATELTGIAAERLTTDRAANILGGAALLAHSQGRQPTDDPLRWIGAIHGNGGGGPRYVATSGVGAGELYAGQVSDVLNKGFSVRTRSGERVTLRARRTRS